MPPIFELMPFAFVLGGSLVATFARSGRGASLSAVKALVWLVGPRLDPQRMRARLAPLAARIARDGMLRAEHIATGDDEIDRMTGSLLATRSLGHMEATLAQARNTRLAERQRGADTFYVMAQMAPMMGLAGTLWSLASLAEGTEAVGALAPAVGLAVLTTLHGVVLAHLVADPLASLIERRAAEEDRQRQTLANWFAGTVARHTNGQSEPPRLGQAA